MSITVGYDLIYVFLVMIGRDLFHLKGHLVVVMIYDSYDNDDSSSSSMYKSILYSNNINVCNNWCSINSSNNCCYKC